MISRRQFISTSGMAMLALPLRGQTVLGANDTVRMAIIGCGGRGTDLAKMFSRIDRVAIAAICDPDTEQMDRIVAKLQKQDIDISGAAKIQDYRRVYERDDIDAVVIASPNHWHSLLAIQAMEAGKDVYVEKPVTHNLWEGKQLVAAAHKYGRVIGAGLQNRSDPGPIEGVRFVQEGNLGKILSVHSCCFRNRSSIGKRDTPLTPPGTVDYNLWLGPAQDLPMHRPRFHYDWHWVWNTGDGDTGNQAPHEIDLACWVLGDGPLPTAMNSFGGRLAWNDGGETPNMMSSWYEQNGVPVIIEVNDVRVAPDRNASPARDSIRVGVIVRCEGGTLKGGRGGMYVVGEDGKTRIHKFPGNGGADHQKNFIQAVRSQDVGALTARIETSARSAAIAHLANIAYRSGGQVDGPTLASAIGDNALLQTIVTEQNAQLKNWGIDQPGYTLGKTLTFDPASAEVTTPDIDPVLAHPPGRGKFVVPNLT